jgi:hypothetical protein
MQPQALACAGTGWKACVTGNLVINQEKSLVSKGILPESVKQIQLSGQLSAGG